MTNKKTTRRALVTSILSLLLCLSMLVGTTFAWFTDSVTSGVNKIVAGNLDVELYWSTDCATWTKVDENTNIFDQGYWEPGHTEVVYLQVRNEGTLHLKYQLGVNVVSETGSVNVAGEDFKLSQYIQYGVVETDSKYENREAAVADVANATKLESPYSSDVIKLAPKDQEGDKETVALVVYMPETVGNEANHRGAEPTILLGLNVFATQVEAEEDSFGPDYDAAADTVVLPAGATAEDFGTNVAVDGNGNYYATFAEAVKSGADVLYLKPEADLGAVTHLDVVDDLTIYGNNAVITGGERDLAVDTYQKLTKDVTINIYSLDGVAVWGQRNTEYTVNVNLVDCQDMNRVYINGTSGVNNISLENCSFNGSSACSVYSNANGTITVTGTTFTNVGQPINLNHKVAGTQTVTVTNCDFVNCGNIAVDTNKWAAAIRVLSSAADAKSVLTVSDVTFTGAEGYKLNGDILLNDTLTGNGIVLGNVEATVPADAVVSAYPGTIVNGVATEEAPVQTPVAGSTGELTDAINSGNSTVVLSAGSYTLPSAVNGKTLTVVGTEDAVVSISNTQGINGANVSFEGVTIQGNTSGQYNGFAHAGEMTYTNCVIEGTLTVYSKSTFNNCTFNLPKGCYIWCSWGSPETTFEGCTFNTAGKAILVYHESGTGIVNVSNCVFNATAGDKAGAIANQNCAAIEIDNSGKGVGSNTACNFTVNTSGNTYSENFSGEWRIKTCDPAGTIVINGTSYLTIAIDGKIMTIDADKNVTVQ